MAPFLALLIFLQSTQVLQGYSHKSRTLDIEGIVEEESSLTETSFLVQNILGSVLPDKLNSFIFAEDSPVKNLLKYDYSKVIESVQSIADAIAVKDSSGYHLRTSEYVSLIQQYSSIFVKTVPRYIPSIASVRNTFKIFAVTAKKQARSLTSEVTTTTILLYAAGSLMLGGIFLITIPVISILGTIFFTIVAVALKGGKNLVKR